MAKARKFVSALIQIDFEIVGKWDKDKQLTYSNFENLTENLIVRELIQSEVAKVNANLAKIANNRKFHILSKELDYSDDEVTETLKVRGSKNYGKYAEQNEGLYSS